MKHKDIRKNDVTLIDVNANNLSETGFFCYMSKKKSEGYRKKLDWLKHRFAEGLKIKTLRKEMDSNFYYFFSNRIYRIYRIFLIK